MLSKLLLYYIFCFHQANVETGRSIHQIPCKAAMNSVEWNPKCNLLAYAGDDKNKYMADEGMVSAIHSLVLCHGLLMSFTGNN